MAKGYNFSQQIKIGELGVEVAKQILLEEYGQATDYRDEKGYQKRGVDIYVPELGYIEVKADSHEAENFYFELMSHGKPGAIDRSQSDWFCVLFYHEGEMYLIPTSYLHRWLRVNYTIFGDEYSIHTTKSYVGSEEWRATGVIVPIDHILQDIPKTITIEYDLGLEEVEE